MYFWSYGFWKTWLDKCLKSPASEDPSTSNMVNRPKHCWNIIDSTATIFINHCENNSVGKSLSQANAKYWDILLTHRLPMKSILFLIDTIYCNIFRCNYLKKKKIFSQFFVAFWKSRFNLEHLQKKRWLSYLMYFWSNGPRKTWLDKCLKLTFQRTLGQVML